MTELREAKRAPRWIAYVVALVATYVAAGAISDAFEPWLRQWALLPTLPLAAMAGAATFGFVDLLIRAQARSR